MGNVITLSRQFGTLGRPLAKELADRLGFKFLDPEIIERAAEKMGMDVEELRAYDNQMVIKNHLDGSKYIAMASPLGFGDTAKQAKLYKVETEIIMEEAEKNDCVIVGRAADYLFSKMGKEDIFRVHVTAPYEHRYEQCITALNLTRVEAAEHIKIIDKARAKFYESITGEDFNSPKYRDLILNMEYIDFEDAVDVVEILAQKRFSLN
jgi:cytidylate kinase